MEPLSAVLALCEGNSSVIGGSPHKETVMKSFDIFDDDASLNNASLYISVDV